MCLPADMFHTSFSLLFQLHESGNGLLQVEDSSILDHHYGLGGETYFKNVYKKIINTQKYKNILVVMPFFK